MQSDPFGGIQFCSSKDMQAILGVSRSFIQKIISEKLIPTQKVSGCWIFPKNAVLKFPKNDY